MDGRAAVSKQHVEGMTGAAMDGRGVQKFRRGDLTVGTERKISALPHGEERGEKGRGKGGCVSATDHAAPPAFSSASAGRETPWGRDVEPGGGQKGTGENQREE